MDSLCSDWYIILRKFYRTHFLGKFNDWTRMTSVWIVGRTRWIQLWILNNSWNRNKFISLSITGRTFVRSLLLLVNAWRSLKSSAFLVVTILFLEQKPNWFLWRQIFRVMGYAEELKRIKIDVQRIQNHNNYFENV